MSFGSNSHTTSTPGKIVSLTISPNFRYLSRPDLCTSSQLYLPEMERFIEIKWKSGDKGNRRTDRWLEDNDRKCPSRRDPLVQVSSHSFWRSHSSQMAIVNKNEFEYFCMDLWRIETFSFDRLNLFRCRWIMYLLASVSIAMIRGRSCLTWIWYSDLIFSSLFAANPIAVDGLIFFRFYLAPISGSHFLWKINQRRFDFTIKNAATRNNDNIWKNLELLSSIRIVSHGSHLLCCNTLTIFFHVVEIEIGWKKNKMKTKQKIAEKCDVYKNETETPTICCANTLTQRANDSLLV